MPRDKCEEESAKTQGFAGMVGSISDKPYNQVDSLELNIEKLQAIIREQKEELLNYRRVAGRDNY
jgi:hypothetical protein